MAKRIWQLGVVSVCFLVINGCCDSMGMGGDTGETVEPITEVEVATPEPIEYVEPVEPTAPGPGWGIPDARVPGEKGDNVFAVTPKKDDWDKVVWRMGSLTSVKENFGTVKPDKGDEVEGVPGALMAGVREGKAIEEGGAVYIAHEGLCQVARVEEITGKTVEVRAIIEGETETIKATKGEDVAIVPKRIQAMGLVAYRKSGEVRLGTIAAASEGKVWVIMDDDKVREFRRDALAALTPGNKWGKGTGIYALGDDGAFHEATIAQVKDGHLRYEVNFTDEYKDSVRTDTVPFYHVAGSITPGEKGPRFEASGTGSRSAGGSQRGSSGKGPTKVGRPNK